ncbi:trimethylamine methyltransferase family protein, partial [Candidatus Latescibacterota bacterium]
SGGVRLPLPLQAELLSQAPGQYEIAGANGFRRTIGGGERHCVAIVTDPWILDYGAPSRRHPSLEDVRRHTRIAQRLDEVGAISLMDYPVTDRPGPHSSLHALEAFLLSHAKHLYVLATSLESLDRYLLLAEVLAEGRNLPMMTVGVASLSPLTLTAMNGDLLLRACEHGMPIVPTVCPMAGATGPYGNSGMLLLGHAENLFMAALAQMVRPGHPFLYAQGPSITDMRSGEDLYYTLDKVLWKLASAQLGRACGLPTTAECGGTMPSRHDVQSGAEGLLFMLSAWESGADVLAGIGSCGNAVAMSGEMMVLQTGWLAAARFLGDGIRVSVDADMDSIRRVGPGGQFMDDALTLERLRSGEFFDGELFDYGDGEAMLARAHALAEELSAEADSPLPGEMQEGVRRLLRDEYARAES